MMNRKNGANPKKIDPVKPLREEFENDEEYSRAYKNSLLDNASFTPEQYKEIQTELTKKIGRPIRFAAYEEKLKDDVFDTDAVNLDLALLYRECIAQCESDTIEVVLHKITRRSAAHERLFRWHKFNRCTQPFIKPVHFQLGSGKTLMTTLNLNGTTTTTTQSAQTTLQNRLIRSHHEPKSLALEHLVVSVESLLDVTLTKTIVHRDALFLFFEWSDPMPFVFIMAFAHHFSGDDSLVKRLASYTHTAYVFTRRDIIAEEGTAAEEIEEEEEPIVTEAEEEAERRKTRLTLIHSECADGNKMMTILKRVLRSVFIQYITSAYMKRD